MIKPAWPPDPPATALSCEQHQARRRRGTTGNKQQFLFCVSVSQGEENAKLIAQNKGYRKYLPFGIIFKYASILYIYMFI